MTISTKVVLFGTALAAAYDLVAATLDTIDVFMPEFLDDETALILGATSLGSGAATAVAGLGTRALTRVDINRIRALSTVSGPASEDEARHVVGWAWRIAKAGESKLAGMSIKADRNDLMRAVHERTVKTLSERPGGLELRGPPRRAQGVRGQGERLETLRRLRAGLGRQSRGRLRRRRQEDA